MHPPPVGVTCALQILIRLARHSHTTSLNISSTPHLLETIIRNFMPLSIDELGINLINQLILFFKINFKISCPGESGLSSDS